MNYPTGEYTKCSDQTWISIKIRTQEILRDILKVLQDSTAAQKDEDIWSSFWSTYDRVAEAYDNKFIARSNSDMDIVLIFVSYKMALN